jgi:cell division protein FtsQ
VTRPMTRSGRPGLLTPRTRAARSVDVGRRDSLIARQGAARRRRVRRSLRAAGALLLAGTVLAAIGFAGALGVGWLTTAPAFAVAHVDIVGARRLAKATVLAAAGIEPGANLFAIEPDAVEHRVAALGGLRSVHVVRRLPNRVTLTLEEREPYALVNPAGPGKTAGLFWIDAEGRLVGPARRPGPPPLPVLSGVELPAPGPSASISDHLRVGLALLRAIQRTGDRAAGWISEIEIGRTEGPVLYTIDGTVVRVGPRAWGERLGRLEGVLEDLEARGERAESIDLRFRDQVVLRPRSAPAPVPAARHGGSGPRRPGVVSGGPSGWKEPR